MHKHLLSFDSWRPSLRNSREYPHIPYISKKIYVESPAYILPLIVWVYLNSSFSGGLRKTVFYTRVCFGRSRSSKVIDFGLNRKRVCDFPLVRYSNLVRILHRFRDIAGFCAHDPTPIPPYFGAVPVGQDPLGQYEHVP